MRPLLGPVSAGVTALVDGIVVGGWYASQELDGDRSRRRRVRCSLTAAYLTDVVVQEVLWVWFLQPAGWRPAEEPALTAREVRRMALAVTGAVVVLAAAERPALRALRRAGAPHPRRALGLAAGVVWAGTSLAVWAPRTLRRAQARQALVAMLASMPDKDLVSQAMSSFVGELRALLDRAVARHPQRLDVAHEDRVAARRQEAGWLSTVRVRGALGAPDALVELWVGVLDVDLVVQGDVPHQGWWVVDDGAAGECLSDVDRLVDDLAGPAGLQALAAAAARQPRPARRLRWLRRRQAPDRGR